jgi:hypothetical protein
LFSKITTTTWSGRGTPPGATTGADDVAGGEELEDDADGTDDDAGPDDDVLLDPNDVHPASATAALTTRATRRSRRVDICRVSLRRRRPIPVVHSGAVTSSDADDGARRAAELLELLGSDDSAADRLLAELTDVRSLVFVGAGLTAIARSEARFLPPAQRAQANSRQVRLGVLRDASRTDPDGLRSWLRRSAEEVQLIRSLRAAADRIG